MLDRSPNLFSYAQAQTRRDVGMDRARSKQEKLDPVWSGLAFAAIERIAKRQATVHVDDVLTEFTAKPICPNAWGAVWQRAIRLGLITHSGRVAPCKTDKRKNAHLYPIYVSNVSQAA